MTKVLEIVVSIMIKHNGTYLVQTYSYFSPHHPIVAMIFNCFEVPLARFAGMASTSNRT